MTDRQKFLMQIAYKYAPQYAIMNDRDRSVFTLRVWLSAVTVLSITDVPSLAGTNKFQVRVCEQTKSYFAPSPRVGELDRLFGKKSRATNKKYSIVDADKIVAVLSKIEFIDKKHRSSLNEEAVWVNTPRDVWF